MCRKCVALKTKKNEFYFPFSVHRGHRDDTRLSLKNPTLIIAY